MSDRLIARYLNLIPYDDGLREQTRALESLARDDAAAIVLGLEHHPVITLGVRGDSATDLHVDTESLRENGLSLRSTGRGGQATLHSPGQLVIYPCVKLRAFHLGARSYVQLIEQTTLTWLAELGIQAKPESQEPGLFVDGKKLAAFGFQISRGLTSHGIAINVSNDLALFDFIRTCGVARQPLTKLQDLSVSSSLEALFLSWFARFRANLEAIAVDGAEAATLV